MRKNSRSRFRPRLERLEQRIVLSHVTGHDPPGQGGGGNGGGGGDQPALFAFESAMGIGDFASAVSVNQQDGSYVVAGDFAGTIDLDPSSSHPGDSDLLASAGGNNIFLARYAADGTFLWARRPSGTYDGDASAAAIDPAGNIYLTGYFVGTVNLGQNTLHDGVVDNLLAKYDANGNLLWSRVMGGDTGRVEGWRIAADGQGVYLTGSFQQTADFDLAGVHPGDVDVLHSQGQRDVFVVRYQAADGAFDWIRSRGGSAGDDTGLGITLSGSSVLVSGHTRVVDGEAFVWKMRAADGADDEATGAGWYRQTESDTTDGLSFTPAMNVAVDNNGNAWVAGAFAGGVDFDPGDPTTASALTTLQGRRSSSADGFVWKLSADSGDHLWVGAIGGSAFDRANAIATDVDGNVYVTGRIEGVADFDPGTGKKETYQLGQRDSERSYVLKLDNDGGMVGAIDMGNVDTHGWDIALTAGSNPDVLAVGGFASEGNFGDITLTSAGSRDGYLVKLSQNQQAALTSGAEGNQLRASAKPGGGGGGGGGGGKGGAPNYTIMSLGSLGGGPRFINGKSGANDINDAGQVVGWTTLRSDEISVPFLINPLDANEDGTPDTWYQDDDGDGTNDLMIPLGALGGPQGFATAINANGQIVGQVQDASFDRHAFLINPVVDPATGQLTWFHDPDGDGINNLMIDLGLGQASGINDSGQIVGFEGRTTSLSTTSFVIDPKDVNGDGVLDWFDDAGDGTNALMIDLNVGDDGTHAFDINNAGRIVGNGAFGGFVITPETSDPDGDSRWVRDSDGNGFNDLAVVLPDAIGGADSWGNAISNTNFIAGSAQPEGTELNQAAQWRIDPSGSPVVSVLGLLKKSDNWSRAQDVNDDGVVVGHSQGARGGQQPREPFVAVNGEMTPFESLVTDMGGFDDLDEIWGVNNEGYIVGSDAEDDAWFTDPRAFIAIPGQPTNNLATVPSSAGADSQSLTVADVESSHNDATRRLQHSGIKTTKLRDVAMDVTNTSQQHSGAEPATSPTADSDMTPALDLASLPESVSIAHPARHLRLAPRFETDTLDELVSLYENQLVTDGLLELLAAELQASQS